MINKVYISLGSNIHPTENLISAIDELSRIGRIGPISSVWETAPVGITEQANFLNAVLLLETGESLASLLFEILPGIENKLGRDRQEDKFGPRTIDLDLILFNDFVGEIDGKRIPSPEILERAFVGIPLGEIAGEEFHPEIGLTYTQISAGFEVGPDEMIQRSGINLITRN